MRVLIGKEGHLEDGNRVKKYVSEMGVRENELDWARKECMDRKRWRSVCHGHLLERHFQRELGVGAIE